MTMMSVGSALRGHLLVAAAVLFAPVDAAMAEPAMDHPPPLSPEQALGRFKVAAGLQIGLVAAEPDVTQPLSITFDDRGRMWVLQYRQYPQPEGLREVQRDQYLRTRYDRVPEAPPRGPKGQDRISIYEDADGDGRFDPAGHFLSDLNLASGMALGYDGVFVVQPPYLLYYADLNRDDRPDGPPDVLLQGFGMEDAHAFANSLTWGPDGWLYGAQGSTVTANIRGIEFQQGLWRYHPRTRAFELFAEGGGNSWGVEFDRLGNVFAAGNTVEPLVHHVQGAYYVKGFGKHGPLHNPYAYGYFPPVLHHGYVGDSLTGGAVLYQGGAFPAQFDNACIAPNTRHSACRWSTVEPRGSTFATRAAGDFVTSDDVWFRPVDMAVGPDGAVYIADWYDYNISHSSPANRSEWYQPSRLDGRIWRVAPAGVRPLPGGSIDLGALSTKELLAYLTHRNDWYARQARRLLAERRDRSVLPELRHMALGASDQREALQGLWGAYVCGGLDDELAEAALDSPHEYVRAWTVRLLGDAGHISPAQRGRLAHLAATDPQVVVRSQLACSARRLPAEDAEAILRPLIRRDEDRQDPHLPLLLWWAVESKMGLEPGFIPRLLETPADWERPLLQDVLLERIARRYTDLGTSEGIAACERLLKVAPSAAARDRLVSGMLQALSGRTLTVASESLHAWLTGAIAAPEATAREIELAVRAGVGPAAARAITAAADRTRSEAERVSLVRALGESRAPEALESLRNLLGRDDSEAFQVALFSALGYFDEPSLAGEVLRCYAGLSPAARSQAITMLCGRRPWARTLVEAVDAHRLPPTVLSLDQVRQLQGLNDKGLGALIVKHWGHVQPATSLEKEGRISAVRQILGRRPGDTLRGRELFVTKCAGCHKLHGAGAALGPDLTGAERKNRELLLRNVIDPSSQIRQEYRSFVATTTDGRILTGLLAASQADAVTLLDAQNKLTVIRRSELEGLEESAISLMPERLLDDLTSQQIQDLIAYIQSDTALPPRAPAVSAGSDGCSEAPAGETE